MVYEPTDAIVEQARWLLDALSERLGLAGEPLDVVAGELELALDAVVEWCVLLWAEGGGRFEDQDTLATDAAAAWVALCMVRFESTVQTLRGRVELALEDSAREAWEADVATVSRIFGQSSGDWVFALEWLTGQTEEVLRSGQDPW